MSKRTNRINYEEDSDIEEDMNILDVINVVSEERGGNLGNGAFGELNLKNSTEEPLLLQKGMIGQFLMRKIFQKME